LIPAAHLRSCGTTPIQTSCAARGSCVTKKSLFLNWQPQQYAASTSLTSTASSRCSCLARLRSISCSPVPTSQILNQIIICSSRVSVGALLFRKVASRSRFVIRLGLVKARRPNFDVE